MGRRTLQGVVHSPFSLLKDSAQMVFSKETLCMNLIDTLRPLRTCGEPSVLRDHLYSTN